MILTSNQNFIKRWKNCCALLLVWLFFVQISVLSLAYIPPEIHEFYFQKLKFRRNIGILPLLFSRRNNSIIFSKYDSQFFENRDAPSFPPKFPLWNIENFRRKEGVARWPRDLLFLAFSKFLRAFSRALRGRQRNLWRVTDIWYHNTMSWWRGGGGRGRSPGVISHVTRVSF